jgi:hypothetical protein
MGIVQENHLFVDARLSLLLVRIVALE